MLEPIHAFSKKDQVALAVKQAILSGVIEPGSAIVESKIAQEVGAGIPLVREALIELEHQGFVQRVPYKGTRVTKLEQDGVKSLFQLRVELEALAIEWAKEHVNEGDVSYLRDKVDRMKRAASELDLQGFYDADLAFHRKIWALSGNPYLADALERIVVPLFAFFLMKYTRQRETYVDSACVHEQLVDAFPKMTGVELRELMKETLGVWKDDAMNLLFDGHKSGQD
jgi:DNA-binding GntR family transcriptional regulator